MEEKKPLALFIGGIKIGVGSIPEPPLNLRYTREQLSTPIVWPGPVIVVNEQGKLDKAEPKVTFTIQPIKPD